MVIAATSVQVMSGSIQPGTQASEKIDPSQ